MVEKIFFHCGTHKTGTSSIQNWLYEDRSKNLEDGLLYPLAGLTSLDGSTGFRHRNLVDKNVSQAFFEEIVKEIDDSGAKIVIFSCETFTAKGRAAYLQNLVRRLKSHFHVPVIGIIYFRNLDDFARAHYREFTRRWYNKNAFPDYCEAPKRVEQFDYCMIAKRMREIFGENLLVRNFELCDDVRRDFSDCIEFQTQAFPQKTYNTSLSAIDVEMVRWLNVQEYEDDIHEFLVQSLLENSPFKPDKDYKKIKEYTQQNVLRPDNQYINEFATLTAFKEQDLDVIFENRAPDFRHRVVRLRDEILEYCEACTPILINGYEGK